MSRCFPLKFGMVLLVILSMTTSTLLFAENDSDSEVSLDSIERSLELDRHEHLIARIEHDAVLNHFTTDGCSGGLSKSWEKLAADFPDFAERHGALPPWQECCVIHDRAYHAGGAGMHSASESFERRKQADLELKSCVVDTGLKRSAALQDIYDMDEHQVRNLYVAISELMYRAVRVGGIPCTDQPWRWGYGWPKCRQEENKD